MSFASWYRRYYLLVNLPVLFLIAELVLTSLDPAHRAPSDLDKALARYDSAPPGSEPTVLLLGNSGVRFGIDAAQLQSALGPPWHVYNFGMGGVRTDDALALAQYVIARGIKPAVVVLGINAFLVDDRVNPDSRFPWLQRTSPYLYFHRSQLRRLIKKRFRHSTDPDDPGATEPVLQTDAQREAVIEPFLSEFDGRPVDDFTLVDDIPPLLAWFHDQHIPVYVVVLPLSSDGTHRLAIYPSLLAALRQRAPAGSLDVASDYAPDEFFDVGHLNARGRKRLTSRVAEWLRTKPELAR